MNKLKIAIIREGKVPPDLRTPMVPYQCGELMHKYPELQVVIEPASYRCFKESEFEKFGVLQQTDLRDCEILLGIKEVPSEQLIANKTYLFFSHTIKKQAHNKNLLREVLKKNIRLIDYETLVWENGHRILGFGRFAGVVGTHNGILTWGKKYELFNLKPAWQCRNYMELKTQYSHIKIPGIKIALCGDGRVAHGSLEMLRFMKIKEISAEQFVSEEYTEPVFVHLRSDNYYCRKDGKEWDKSDFYHSPEEYISSFKPFYEKADMMINAIFWHPRIPAFFTKEEMKSPSFRIKVIADISCDIEGSIPCTVKATTIEDPVYGWHTHSEKLTAPFLKNTVDVMAVGNLPCELPTDSSTEFGESLIRHVMPHLIDETDDAVILRATIAENGKLTERYKYLEDYVA